MSTYLYLKCLDHDPPIGTDGESGQHLSDLDQIRADIANREAIVAAIKDDWTNDDHFRRNTARFLAQHPKCRVGIIDEYGKEYETVVPNSYEDIAARAKWDEAFQQGLLAAARVCRANDVHTSGPPCPATMAAVYIERLAAGELP